MSPIPDRNLALELIRVTETAAIAAAPWVGRGEKNLADKAAVEAIAAVSVTRINSRAKLRSGIGDIIRGSLSLQGILTARQSWDSHDRHEMPDQLWFLLH